MSQRSKSIAPLLSLCALTGLAACATTAPPDLPTGPSSADRHQISVTQSSERMELAAGQGAWALDQKGRDDLEAFARSYSRLGHGALVLSTPSGGANSDSAARVAQEARLHLVDLGVPYGAVAGATYDASGQEAAPIILSFSRYEATAPECAPLWQQDLAHPEGGTAPYESFGCANNANLAAMIEDPRDLLGPRDEEARDSGRRGTVMGRYREGQPTHANRSSDERVTISNAVN
ncbi:MAG: CpaD family pilus assembly protein [Hyphomonadaceae bacterium]